MNKVKIVLLMASMVLAVTFTFSCSSDDGGSGGSSPSVGDGGSSSSEGTQGGVSSSSGGGGLSSSVLGGTSSSDGGGAKITKSKITGVSQKGPFVEGSTVTLYELNSEFAQTGRSFKSIISDNKGSFEIRGVELISPYAMLEASGYYRNEVTGELSKGTITLFAIADVREKDNFNVNLLTHLEYYRVLNLAESGKSVAEAKKQAQKEILAVFGIDGDFKNSEDMSIFGATEGDAALLAISVLLQGDLSEGEFSQRLTNFAQSLKESGKWENETAKAAIVEWARMDRYLTGIRSNIVGWGLSSEVPDFEKYVNNYWAMAYGLGGCGSANEGEVKKDNRNDYHICENGKWTLASVWEYDTYQWVACSVSNEGEIKKGNVSVWEYICKNKIWRTATQLERDTYQWSCSATNEGEIKKVNVNDNVYICKNKVWQEAYKEKYCFENKNKCTYFTDARDNQQYAYVVIGEQTWMAENLNYEAVGSMCYNNLDSNCDIYGRLYNWETAKTVCPSGWHLPSNAEWDVLVTYAGGEMSATSGWYSNSGTDQYGFSALPGGYGYSSGSFSLVGSSGYWWSATGGNASHADLYIIYGSDRMYRNVFSKSNLYSVRCMKD